MTDRDTMRKGDALILVDVQNAFCPGGALPIEGGDVVVPVLNHAIAAAPGPCTACRTPTVRGFVPTSNCPTTS